MLWNLGLIESEAADMALSSYGIHPLIPTGEHLDTFAKEVMFSGMFVC